MHSLPEGTGSTETPGVELFFSHVQEFWTSEQRNADRMHHRRQFLLGVAIPLLGLIAAGVPVITGFDGGRILPRACVAWFLVACTIISLLLFSTRALRLTAIAVAIVLDALLAILALFGAVQSGYFVSVSVGALMACAITAVSFLAIACFYLLHRPDPAEDEGVRATLVADLPPDPDWTATGWFVLSQRRLNSAALLMNLDEAALFRRRYEAATDLLGRNLRVGLRLRNAQKALVIASMLLPGILLFSLQARLADRPTITMDSAKRDAGHGSEVSKP